MSARTLKFTARGLASTPTETPIPNQKKLNVAFYDARSYWKPYFHEKDGYSFADLKFIGAKLDKNTAQMAQGCDVACLFVNDSADAATLEALQSNGVRMIAIRAAGFNNVDLV